MGAKTTFTCDRCGHTQDNDDQMWSVGLVYIHGNRQLAYGGGSNSVYKAAMWCRECMQAMKVLGSYSFEATKVPDPTPPPSLEDLIREIAREEVTVMTGAS